MWGKGFQSSFTVLCFSCLSKNLPHLSLLFLFNCCCLLLLSRQSCPTLCDPIDGSSPGSPIPGILQARTVEWVAISFSNAWKWKVKVKSLSRVWLLATPWTAAYQAPPSMGVSTYSTAKEHFPALSFPPAPPPEAVHFEDCLFKAGLSM